VGPNRVVDIGTGSGCIAISLAANLPNLEVIATDISAEALRIARLNAQKHTVAERVHLLQSDLLTPFAIPDSRFDLICANLPYIPRTTLRTLEVYAREPSLALDGGFEGLALIRELLHTAHHYLAPGGLLLLEIEASQGPAVFNLAQEAFPRAKTRTIPDLAKHDRLIRVETTPHTAYTRQ
jgi:release factor glutamine methyltransferase